MCGRFTLASDPAAVQAAFPGVEGAEQLAARYNVAPTQAVAVIRNNGLYRIEMLQWGLIPSWAKDPAIGSRLINARAETLAEKPSFRTAFRRRRCLILADGFYEWRTDPTARRKTPIYIRLKSGQPFAFAGLWEEWRTPNGEALPTCTIVTTTPNELLETVHNRMPVILPHAAHDRWLAQGEQDTAGLAELLRPFPAEEMEAVPVSTRVNDPRYDAAELLNPV